MGRIIKRGRPSKFTVEQMGEIIAMIEKHQEGGQLVVSDVEMSDIITSAGFSVNTKYVERLRRSLNLSPFKKRRKFYDDELSDIHRIIKGYVQEDDWRLAVSDAKMADILLEQGYDVNTKYVERTRRSLGIEPRGVKGGPREGAGRPSMASNIIDEDYAIVMINHFSDTHRLSWWHQPSGALLGSSGIDLQDRFGCHTTDFEVAIKRKEKRLARLVGMIKRPVKAGTKIPFKDCLKGLKEIEQVFSEQINRYVNSYGKKRGAGVLNTRATQAYYSL